jgi:hypothetical protein
VTSAIRSSTSFEVVPARHLCPTLAARGIMNPYNKLEEIYNKHRFQYKENGDTKQMCCMWSTNDPPDIVEGTQPFQDIEKAFSIKIESDDAFEMYEMTLRETLISIQQIQKSQAK